MSDKILKQFSGVVKSDTYTANVEAGQIVEAARALARQIETDAEQNRQATLTTARQQGYEQGLREWNAAVVAANTARDKYLSDSMPELISLAIRIAGKIIGGELQTNPEAIVDIARQSLQSAGRGRSLALRVSAAEAEMVRRRVSVLREAAGPNRSIEIVADAAIPAGGCVVETEYGVIDARLETQLRCMEEALLRAARR
jgi:type III secretion protein L